MRRLAALGAFAVVLLVLVVSQIVLPGIAAQQLRDRLARSGHVVSVSVHAFPAVELLWHQADSVDVRMSSYRSTANGLASLLNQANQVGTLRVSVDQLDTGLLTLRNARLVKRGSQMVGTADVTEADLRTALPILQSVVPLASGDGTLTVRGTASLLGVSASVDATVSVQAGALVVTPDVPLGGLATLRVFSDRHLDVQSISAAPTSDGFSVRAAGRLR